MICCLCRKPLKRAIHELRPSGPGGSTERWNYCRKCWKETRRQQERLREEPPHAGSSLAGRARIGSLMRQRDLRVLLAGKSFAGAPVTFFDQVRPAGRG